MYAEALIEEALAEIRARDHHTRCTDGLPKFWDEAENYVQYGVRRRSHESALANAEGWMGIYPISADTVIKVLPKGVIGDYPPPPCGHESEYVMADGCQCCEHETFAQAYPGVAEFTNFAKGASISLWLIPAGYACATVPDHAEKAPRTGGRRESWHDVDMDRMDTMSGRLREQCAEGRRADEGDPVILSEVLRPGRYGKTAYPNGTDSPQVLLVHDTRRGSPSAIRIAIDYTPTPDPDSGVGPSGAVRHTGTLLPASPECPALGWAIRWDDPAWLGEARVGLSFTLEGADPDPTQSPFLYLVWVCEMPEGVADPPGETRIVSTVGKREHGWAPRTELTAAECAALGIGWSEAEMEMEAARAWYRREEYDGW